MGTGRPRRCWAIPVISLNWTPAVRQKKIMDGDGASAIAATPYHGGHGPAVLEIRRDALVLLGLPSKPGCVQSTLSSSQKETPSSSLSPTLAAVDSLEWDFAEPHRPLYLVPGERPVRLDYFALSLSLWSMLESWAPIRRSWISSPAMLR
jgi:hypothetical protein